MNLCISVHTPKVSVLKIYLGFFFVIPFISSLTLSLVFLIIARKRDLTIISGEKKF